MGSAIGKFAGKAHVWTLWVALCCFGSALAQNTTTGIQIDSLLLLDEYGHLQRIKPQQTIDLPARQNFLSLTLFAKAPTPVLYQLEGLDENWFQGFSTDRIHYTNLAGGQYRFRVRAANGGPETQLTINIEAPFWKSWWFGPTVVLYVLSVLGVLGYLFLQYRFRQKIRFFQTRDQIARDLHDDMGSYLSSISIMSRSAANATAKDPERARQSLDKIGETARQVMGAMSDIVWSINPDHDSLSHVLARMQDAASELFADTDTTLSVEADPAVLTLNLPLDKRHDFFLIYKEAITNAARYSEATEVRVRLHRAGTGHSRPGHSRPGHSRPGLTLVVQDNGKGFDTTQPKTRSGGGNGLKNMHVRAQKIGATLTVESDLGSGTTVTVWVQV